MNKTMTKQAEQIKHTATPWKVENGIIRTPIFDNKVISRDEIRANAQFIVKAVNNHDALVEALEALTNYCDNYANTEDSYEFINQAKKALSQAKVE